jgi:gas vesicle protein
MNIKLIGGIIGIAAILGFGWYCRSVVAERDDLKVQVNTLQQTILDYEADIKQCNADKVIAENVAQNRSNKIRDLTKQLDADSELRDPRNARCVPITK